MCEAKPGLRCAAETCDGAHGAVAGYREAYPQGPAVDPVSAVEVAWARVDEAERPVRDAVEATGRQFTSIGGAARITDYRVRTALAETAAARDEARRAHKDAQRAEASRLRAQAREAEEVERAARYRDFRAQVDAARATAFPTGSPVDPLLPRHGRDGDDPMSAIRAAVHERDLSFVAGHANAAQAAVERAERPLRAACERAGLDFDQINRSASDSDNADVAAAAETTAANRQAARAWAEAAQAGLRDLDQDVETNDLAVRHLRAGDTVGSEKVEHCYRSARTSAGNLSVRLASQDDITGERRVRDLEWRASTVIRDVRSPAVLTAPIRESVPYEPGVFTYEPGAFLSRRAAA